MNTTLPRVVEPSSRSPDPVSEKAAPSSAPTVPSRDEIGETLMRQRLETLARRYMRDLRRTAFVDVRV